ncbi:hypothetical protein Bbelb_119880 [Branchiostoma belcheri]|nr:hypothetical protein Bbelb_119880 [Branchiostoma belcheri]
MFNAKPPPQTHPNKWFEADRNSSRKRQVVPAVCESPSNHRRSKPHPAPASCLAPQYHILDIKPSPRRLVTLATSIVRPCRNSIPPGLGYVSVGSDSDTHRTISNNAATYVAAVFQFLQWQDLIYKQGVIETDRYSSLQG